MSDKPIYMTATEIQSRWDAWEQEFRSDPAKREDLMVACAMMGDAGALAAVKELVYLGIEKRKELGDAWPPNGARK